MDWPVYVKVHASSGGRRKSGKEERWVAVPIFRERRRLGLQPCAVDLSLSSRTMLPTLARLSGRSAWKGPSRVLWRRHWPLTYAPEQARTSSPSRTCARRSRTTSPYTPRLAPAPSCPTSSGAWPLFSGGLRAKFRVLLFFFPGRRVCRPPQVALYGAQREDLHGRHNHRGYGRAQAGRVLGHPPTLLVQVRLPLLPFGALSSFVSRATKNR
jgi:hypothetical protein